jgi:hypothetical protein
MKIADMDPAAALRMCRRVELRFGWNLGEID